MAFPKIRGTSKGVYRVYIGIIINEKGNYYYYLGFRIFDGLGFRGLEVYKPKP